MRIQILTDQEYAALLSHIDKIAIRDSLIIRVMLQCGLRAGEVCALNIENVWREGHIHPAINLHRSSCKNHKGRYVDIPQPVKACLDSYIASLLTAAYPCIPGKQLFFSHYSKRRLTIRDVHRLCCKVTQAALGRKVRPHIMRHTYATMLSRHTNINVVQELLGHSSMHTTQIYLHPTSQDCKNAVNKAFSQ